MLHTDEVMNTEPHTVPAVMVVFVPSVSHMSALDHARFAVDKHERECASRGVQ